MRKETEQHQEEARTGTITQAQAVVTGQFKLYPDPPSGYHRLQDRVKTVRERVCGNPQCCKPFPTDATYCPRCGNSRGYQVVTAPGPVVKDRPPGSAGLLIILSTWVAFITATFVTRNEVVAALGIGYITITVILMVLHILFAKKTSHE